MKKQAAALPIDVLIILIIAVIVLVMVALFYTAVTGQQIFPSIMDKIKMALGMLNESGVKP